MGNLAHLFRKFGRAAEAEVLFQQVIGIRRRVLGEEHPATLQSMYDLARALHSLGRPSDALALMTQCYDLRKKKLGENHPHTKNTLEHVNY